jgi:negative regulator of sigma E activity
MYKNYGHERRSSAAVVGSAPTKRRHVQEGRSSKQHDQQIKQNIASSLLSLPHTHTHTPLSPSVRAEEESITIKEIKFKKSKTHKKKQSDHINTHRHRLFSLIKWHLRLHNRKLNFVQKKSHVCIVQVAGLKANESSTRSLI